MGRAETEGVDVSVYYDLDNTPFGDFSVRLNAARLLTFFQEPGPEQQLLLDAQAQAIPLINPLVEIPGAASLIEEGRPAEVARQRHLHLAQRQLGAGWFSS
ncbi:MAG: hypothetical protein R3C16_09890 [Hyphomonadaceae bacterium]